MPIVVVGSRNPVKVVAVRDAFVRLADDWDVRAIDVPSGVSPQPIGHDETRAGARNRAVAALAARPDATLGVGLEGGVFEYDDEWYTGAWCAIVDRKGCIGWAGGGLILLPSSVAEGLREGYELGTLMDRLAGEPTGLRWRMRCAEGALCVLGSWYERPARPKSWIGILGDLTHACFTYIVKLCTNG